MVQKGSVLGGRYELTERLGEGGMGAVWIARNTAIGGAEVAVKVMHANLANDATAVERFRNEASIAAHIGHPHIVRVFDFGQSDDGAPFMVMERLVGESLAERLERETSLPAREAAQVVCSVLDALAAAHAKDVLHRDLKPENIFLAREGSATVPKILDFGVSKILGDDAARTKMTRTGAIIGTPAYMSPEQVMGASVDLRSDLWAMGVILYELLTGRLPFDGNNYNAVLVRIATGESDPITAHLPDVDPALAALVERAMQRKPSARFASAEQMREALSDWLDGRASIAAPPARRVPTGGGRSTPFAFEQGDTLPGDTLSPTQTSPRRWGLVAAVGVAAVVSVAALATRAPRPAHTATAPMPPVVSAVSRHALRIEGLPPGAHITVDDEPVMLPVKVSALSDHRVRVSARGFRDWLHVVSMPTGDVTLTWAGEREPEAPDAAAQVAPAQPAVAAQAPRPRGGRHPQPQRAQPAARGAGPTHLMGTEL